MIVDPSSIPPRSATGDVTVVIPSRDRPQRLAATLASVRAQTAPPAEIIVVDDGSAAPLAPRFASIDGVRFVRHDLSRGVAEARNSGIRAAQTAWIALLDDDDLWAPSKLQLQREAADRTGAAWVFGAALLVDGAGRVLEVHSAPPSAGLRDALRAANVVPAGASNVLVRRDLVLEVGLFDHTLHHFADWDLWLRLADAAPAASIPDALVGYVRHASSMQIAEIERAMIELAALDRKHQRAGAPQLGSVWVDQWLAEGLWGAGRRARALHLMLVSAARRRSTAQLRATAALVRAAVRPPRDLPMAPSWARPATVRPPVD